MFEVTEEYLQSEAEKEYERIFPDGLTAEAILEAIADMPNDVLEELFAPGCYSYHAIGEKLKLQTEDYWRGYFYAQAKCDIAATQEHNQEMM